jgi:hypothetical protein
MNVSKQADAAGARSLAERKAAHRGGRLKKYKDMAAWPIGTVSVSPKALRNLSWGHSFQWG